MNHIFIGYDSRQPVAFEVLASSIVRRARKPVAITPLVLSTLPITRRGLTEFTFSRYLVPWLADYRGVSLFLDGDMLALADVNDLFDMWNGETVAVVQGDAGRFEWPSLMLFGNARCRALCPEYIEAPKSRPHDFSWASDITALPREWNHCIGYDTRRPDARLVHFTMGLPCFPETMGSEYGAEWRAEAQAAIATPDWASMMGGSVHAGRLGRLAA